MLDIIIKYKAGFSAGLLVTLKLCLIIWLSGIFLGGIIGVLAAKRRLTVGIPIRVISFTLSGVPVLVFLFWLHYPAQALLDVVIDPFYTAAFTLSIINIFVVSDIIRSAVEELPNQFIEAAKVYGIRSKKRFIRIELPLIFRYVLPSLIMSQVNMLHLTLFASLISVDEIFRLAQRINSQIYRPVEIYSALGIFFLFVSLPVNGLALFLKRKYIRDISEK
jgi:ABC-type amino acid transport system permease subunit